MKIPLFFSLLLFVFQQHVAAEQAKEQNCTAKHKCMIIVSCSGKSGSCTLEASFKQLNLETYRYHGLNQLLTHLILNRSKNANVLIIDSIRDIIARKISAFFQNLTIHIGLTKEEILTRHNAEGTSFIHFLQKEFDKEILTIAQHYAFESWKKYLGYDCLKEGNFNFNKRYQLKKKGNLYFVNLRYDDIKEWQQIIRSIEIPIDLSKFEIKPSNIGESKWYSEIYKAFLSQFTITQANFDAILSCNAEEMAHFYTKEEIENFIHRWKPRIRD